MCDVMTKILRNIGAISRALDSISNIEFKEISLTKGQYLYVVRVFEKPGIILENLAELLRVDKTTASRAVNKLVANGLLTKKMTAKNQKNKQLFVTKKGEEVYQLLISEHKYSEKMALTGLSATEKQQLEELLTKINENVTADWQFVKKGGQRNYEN